MESCQVITLLKELSFDTIDATAECGLTALGIACLRGHLGTARRDFFGRCLGWCLGNPISTSRTALSFRGNGKRDVSPNDTNQSAQHFRSWKDDQIG